MLFPCPRLKNKALSVDVIWLRAVISVRHTFAARGLGLSSMNRHSKRIRYSKFAEIDHCNVLSLFM